MVAKPKLRSEEDLFVDTGARAERVREEVAKIPGSKLGRSHSFILCPYHKERTPSGKVSHDPMQPSFAGSFFCFGCKAKAKWGEIAEKFGLDPLGSKEFVTDKVPKQTLAYYDEAFLGNNPNTHSQKTDDLIFLDLVNDAEHAGLINGMWRGFKLSFLADVGARLCFSVQKELFYVYLPVNVQGKERGNILARLFKEPGGISYLNQSGPWSRKWGLFPYDFSVRMMQEKGHKTMVLVEGPRDALRLLKFGIPTCAILGTWSWSKTKSQLLEFAGVERIVVATDGDNAGKLAAMGDGDKQEGLVAALKPRFEVKNLKLWVHAKRLRRAKLDPGNMPMDLVRRVKNAII